jgi:hypothetical protein
MSDRGSPRTSPSGRSGVLSHGAALKGSPQKGPLQRSRPQLRLHNVDRQFWFGASRWFAGWRDSLLIVKPETVLRWYRRRWRAYRAR